MTFKEAYQIGIKSLEDVGIESAALDARLLLEFVAKLTRTELVLAYQELCPQEVIKNYQDLLKRRSAFEPVAKIIGEKEFWGRSFCTTVATLDPRPDSETLIDVILKFYTHHTTRAGIKHCFGGQHPHLNSGEGAPKESLTPLPHKILDLGTGTGCLLFTLLLEFPQARGVGVDASQQALDVAQLNLERHGLENRAHLKLSNWFEAVEGSFDLIISNPPYIAFEEKEGLSEQTLFDPESALFAENQGLKDYEAIATQAHDFLEVGGVIVLEIGCTQAQAVADIFQKTGFAAPELYQDLGGRDRVLLFKRR